MVGECNSPQVFDSRRARELLELDTGIQGAEFRPGQEQSIRDVVDSGGSLLLVQRTGWGKSAVYFIATKLLRESGSGPALLISPLLALMRNQIEAARRMGVVAETINSSNRNLWREISERLLADEVDILLISPERLANEQFRDEVLAQIAPRIALLVIDEAHCISDWGHDFRPDYRLIARLIGLFPPNLRLLATTATANSRVIADLQSTMGPSLQLARGQLSRPSLHLQTISMPSKAERMAWLAQRMRELDGSGIVYVLTISDAIQLSDWLIRQGLPVNAYSGDLANDERVHLEEALLRNQVKALVATTALGMGFDKPDLRFVFHYQAPQSVVHYYQQVGRAGRAVESAYGVLLGGEEDEMIQNFFIESAFPSQDEADQVLRALEASDDGLQLGEIEAAVNASPARIKQTLRLLELESPAPVIRERRIWKRTIAPLEPAFWDRVLQVTEIRRTEQAQMKEYLSLQDGHMDFLLSTLDSPAPAGDGPALANLPINVDAALVQQAEEFISRTRVAIEPRKMWPQGMGRIPKERMAEEGRALSQWGDPKAQLVQRGKYQDEEFDQRLVESAAKLIRDWSPDPFPRWITCVPSLRRPHLVPGFARRFADDLGIPFVPVLVRTKNAPEQKSMANSRHQARNARDSLQIDSSNMPDGPVLLVDDIVDSRWTMTVSAAYLLSRGSGPVYPFALTKVGR